MVMLPRFYDSLFHHDICTRYVNLTVPFVYWHWQYWDNIVRGTQVLDPIMLRLSSLLVARSNGWLALRQAVYRSTFTPTSAVSSSGPASLWGTLSPPPSVRTTTETPSTRSTSMRTSLCLKTWTSRSWMWRESWGHSHTPLSGWSTGNLGLRL